jgi:hypothetical protein
MSDRVLSVVVAAEEATRELPMDPIAYFLIAFGLFVVALGVTWSFRNNAHKLQGPQHGAHGHHAIESDGSHH